jgi:DNA-binding LacI/PurR family transcriptional regulator
MPTINDIAKRTGLSVATISRAINKSGYVSDKSLKLIEQAIQETSYKPNWMARGLHGKATQQIGLIIPDISNVFYTALAKSITTHLRDLGYAVILCVTDDDPQNDATYLEVLESKQVDGILYVHASGAQTQALLSGMMARKLPIVALNRHLADALLDAVLVDNFRGAYEAVRYLIELGHERIALIVGDPGIVTAADRIRGYQAALAESSLPLVPELLKVGKFSRDYGEQATQELLSLAQPPTAIFATSNRIVMGALSVLGRERVRIPDDLSVLAFNDTEWLSAWNPPISAVRAAEDEMAKLAVDLILRRVQEMENEHIPTRPLAYYLSTVLVKRESCAPPRRA